MHYDLIIIGAGSGGIAAARAASQFPIKILLIEMTVTGGTCVNLGCVPKKISSNLASIIHTIKIAKNYGIKTDYDLNFKIFTNARNEYIKRLNNIYDGVIEKWENVTYLRGKAIVCKDGVFVDDKLYTYDKLILATGAQPMKLKKNNEINNDFVEGHRFLKTSDDFFRLNEIPKKSVIIGSGYIAVELSFILQEIGSEVVVIARGNKILSHFDDVISENVKEAMIKKGIKILFETNIEKVEENKIFTDKCKIKNIDFMMCAIGRDCDLSFIKMDIKKENNFLCVNNHFKTSIDNVYAIGDLIGSKHMLTPFAIFCARKLVDSLFNKKIENLLDHYKIFDYVPSVIFSHPPSASVGISEFEARKLKGEVKIYKSKFINLFYSLCEKEEKENSEFKIVTLDEKVVGLHMFGMGCDEIVQGFSVAMKMGATYDDFKRVVGVHPTAAEEVVTMR
ncbi:hypothetical protein GVAV_001100 [Gurleya vavrai]